MNFRTNAVGFWLLSFFCQLIKVLLLFNFCVRDWSGILFETEDRGGAGSEGEKKYSGKPDGRAGTPRKKDKSRRTKD